MSGITAMQQNPFSGEGQREEWKDKQMERQQKKARPTGGKGEPSPHQMMNRGVCGEWEITQRTERRNKGGDVIRG